MIMAQLWGGRFTKQTDQLVFDFNASITFDKRLFHEDVTGSIVHATMLAKQGILTEEERKSIIEGLTGILEDVDAGKLTIDETQEDIHSFVEATLIDRIGDAGKSFTPDAAVTTRWRWTCVSIPEREWQRQTDFWKSFWKPFWTPWRTT